MSKHVLILSSTPRKGGNSELLCAQFARGAAGAGHTVETISLREKDIRCCTGCGACSASRQCVQKDDMADILARMVAADVIVLATPVYFYSMCAQMKTLIDRTVPRYGEISGKEFYFIVTAADTDTGMMKQNSLPEASGALPRTACPARWKRAFSTAWARGRRATSRRPRPWPRPTGWAETSDSPVAAPA